MELRVRNLKNKKEILENSDYYINVENSKKHKGAWNRYFKNDKPICLEIGCGKCKFIYEKAKSNPDKNFIGIERIDTVLALGIKEIEKNEKISNLVLINLDALEIKDVFSNEIETLYLNFSDPWPKARHHMRRLSSEVFLNKYDNIFRKDKEIYMRTDNKDLFEYSIESLSKHGYILEDVSLDLHSSIDVESLITTEYEDKFSSMDLPIYSVKAIKRK